MSALGPLFAWAPREHRSRITTQGMHPSASSRRAVPDIALCTDAALAWGASEERINPGSMWDLWQVTLDHTDEVHVEPSYGPTITEVRVRNAIAPHQLVWIAERIVTAAEVAWRMAPPVPATHPANLPMAV